MHLAIHTAELRGFLNAVQRLCGPSHSFYADFIELEADEEPSIQSYFAQLGGEFKYQGSVEVRYEQISAFLHEYIYSQLTQLEPHNLKELDWQLIEYYGLASTAVDGPFNPLVSEGAMLLSVTHPYYEKCTYFAVRIPGHLVITSLGIRA